MSILFRLLVVFCLLIGASHLQAAPVLLEGEAVFELPVGYKGDDAAARAASIGRRIEAAANAGLSPGSIRTTEAATGIDIHAAGQYLCTVYPADAQAAGTSMQVLAERQAQAISAALLRHEQEHTGKRLWQAAGFSLAILLAACLIAWLVHRLHRRLQALLVRTLRSTARRLEHKTHRLLRALPMLRMLGGALRLLRLMMFLLIAYVALERVLSLWPATRVISSELAGWLFDPLRDGALVLASALPNLMFLTVLALITRYLLRAVRYLFREVERGNLRIEGFYPDWAGPTQKIASFLLIVFALMVAYPYIPGSGSDAFKGVSLFLGVLFSLGSSGAVSNVVAGVILTYMRAYRAGDLVRIGEVQGVVTSHSLLVTKLHTIRNQEITIPNSVVLQGHVTNLSSSGAERGALVTTVVTIGYDTPWRKVHAILLEAAANTAEVMQHPTPFVLQTELHDFYIRYELNAYTNQPQRLPFVLSALNGSVQDSFNRYGVQIMSPHYFERARQPVRPPPDSWHQSPAIPPDA